MNADVVIIGAGPSGLATSLQLKRYGISHILIEKSSLGGLLKNAFRIDNYLGFPNGISGGQLIEQLEAHSARYGIEIVYDEVLNLNYYEDKFIVKTKTALFSSEIAVIASGTRPNRAKEPGIDRLLGTKIFYEMDAIRNVREKSIGIVGAGDAALDYALSLAGCNDVTIFNRDASEKCIPTLYREASLNRRIKYLKEVVISNLISEGDKLRVTVGFVPNEDVLSFDYLLLAIGREPELGFVDDSMRVSMDELIGDGKLHLIGDVANGDCRQLSIAAGDGIKAAMKIAGKMREQVDGSNLENSGQ